MSLEVKNVKWMNVIEYLPIHAVRARTACLKCDSCHLDPTLGAQADFVHQARGTPGEPGEERRRETAVRHPFRKTNRNQKKRWSHRIGLLLMSIVADFC